jgi:hypothetical protein
MVKRGILIGVCAAAVGLGPIAIASPASADNCPYGTVPTHFSGVCTSGAGGGAPPSGPTTPLPPSFSSSTGLPGTGFTTVDGIPCNSAHSSECIGLAMSQPPAQ